MAPIARAEPAGSQNAPGHRPYVFIPLNREHDGMVPAAPDLRDWLISLAAFARRAADRHVGIGFVIS
jgi:hypothetical protein